MRVAGKPSGTSLSQELALSNAGKDDRRSRAGTVRDSLPGVGVILSILHEDPDLLVLDKRPGVSVLADRSGSGCLWEEIQEFCRETGRARPRTVHRLDKGTSGVLLVALTAECQSALTRQFNSREVVKTYLAVVEGIPDPKRARIDLPLASGRKGRYRVAGARAEIELNAKTAPPAWILPAGGVPFSKPSHPSLTSCRVLRVAGSKSLVLVQPHTGRTHQIRVHLAWLGWPIVGDTLYGKQPKESIEAAGRLMLHARKLVVSTTWRKEAPHRSLVFRAPIPPEFQRWFEQEGV